MNNQTLSDEAKFMSAYLAQHGTCSSWDFDADYNFAVQFGTNDEKELIQDAMRSSAPFSHIIAVWENCWKKSITERRLKALRVLVQHGFARSTWTGLGEGSYNSFGRSRVRSYLHVSAYKEPLTTASKGG